MSSDDYTFFKFRIIGPNHTFPLCLVVPICLYAFSARQLLCSPIIFDPLWSAINLLKYMPSEK